MLAIEQRAPIGGAIAEYDRRHLSIYAALIDAADTGIAWTDAARTILRIDVTQGDAEACWQSHIDRARWIIGAGLASAIEAFGQKSEISGT